MENNKTYLASLYESLENASTVTLSGQQAKIKALKEEKTYKNFNRILIESLSDEAGDTGLNAWANEVIDSTSAEDKVLVNFNTTVERLNKEGDDLGSQLHKATYEDLQYLTELDSSELYKAISSGVLNDYGWVPEFKELNDMITSTSNNLRESMKNQTGSVYSPFSMLSEHNGSVVMRLKGNNYSLGRDGRLYEVEGGDGFGLDVADGVNDAIENIPYNDKDDNWELHSPVGMITISPYEKCVRLNGDSVSCDELKEALTEAITAEDCELEDSDVKDLDHVLRIAENLDDIALLDQVKVFENEITRENMVVVYPVGDSGTEVSVIHDGKLKYADNIEEILGYASETFNIDLPSLQESFKKQIKARKLYEAMKEEEDVLDAELLEELTKDLNEIDHELGMVDAGSEAADALTEARNKITTEIGKVKK